MKSLENYPITDFTEKEYKLFIEQAKTFAMQAELREKPIKWVLNFFEQEISECSKKLDFLDYVKYYDPNEITYKNLEDFKKSTLSYIKAKLDVNTRVGLMCNYSSYSSYLTSKTDDLLVLLDQIETTQESDYLTNTKGNTNKTQPEYIRELINKGLIDDDKGVKTSLESVAIFLVDIMKIEIKAKSLREFINIDTGKPYSKDTIEKVITQAYTNRKIKPV